MSREAGPGRAVFAVLVAGWTGSSPAPAQAAAPETVLDTVNASTPVSAYGGVAVWSSFDTQSKTYKLRAYRDGTVADIPVPSRRAPFDADVGPDASGEPVVAYSRCRAEPSAALYFNELPEWAFARGCNVHRFRFSEGIDHVLRAAASRRRSEVLPSVWGRRLAFFAVAEPVRRGHAPVARLYLSDLSGREHTRSFAGGGGKKVDRFDNTVMDGPSPTALDLDNTIMTFAWSNLQRCAQGDSDSSGEAQAAQIWRQGLRTRNRLASQCTGSGVFGPFFADSTIRWIAPSPAQSTTTLKSSVQGQDVMLPPHTVGAAIGGSQLIVARATDTELTQIVALPLPAASGSQRHSRMH